MTIPAAERLPLREEEDGVCIPLLFFRFNQKGAVERVEF